MEQILIVDLEATCWDDRPQSVEVMEIIEIGCAIVRLDGQLVAGFGQLVKPTDNPQLSQFCQELTTIKQPMVDGAPTYGEAVKLVDEALSGCVISTWGSWGQYDYNQISMEKSRHGIAPAFFDLPHINLKSAWQRTIGVKKKAGLGGALGRLGLDFEGSQHRALDDVKNIARILPYISPAELEAPKKHLIGTNK